MLAQLRPDVLSFATMPHDRLELVKLAAKYKVKGLMFEKPVSTSLAEAKEILDICNAAGIKAILCHQHKYLRSFLKLKEILDSGELGKIYQIQVQCQQHANQIATHYIDYMIWANGGAKPVSVVGHTHGTFYLENSHPSPDYILGEVCFANGVRGLVECGYFSPKHLEHDNCFDHGPKAPEYYTDDRLTVYGETGYAWAECNGRWGAFTAATGGKAIGGDFGTFFEQEQFTAQDRYTRDFGLWLDDDSKVHPSNVEAAYMGYQILEAIYVSALEHRRVDLPMPLPLPYDCLDKLNETLPPVPYRRMPE
jgi:predicted dehydrogenase